MAVPVIVWTDQLAKVQGEKCMIYGPSGVGKTHLISTAPAPFVISAEKGLKTLRKFRIPAIEITSLATFDDAINWFMKSKEAKQIGTLAVDSITEIAEVILAEAKRKAKDPRQAYGDMQDKVYDMMRDLRDLSGPNVYFITQEERAKDEVTGMSMYYPSAPGNKLLQKLPYFVDSVFRMENYLHTDGISYKVVRTKQNFASIAKDRSGNLAEIEPANLTNLFAKMAA